MEITGLRNSQDTEQWQDKTGLEATGKGKKDLFLALKNSEQNQSTKLYLIP